MTKRDIEIRNARLKLLNLHDLIVERPNDGTTE